MLHLFCEVAYLSCSIILLIVIVHTIVLRIFILIIVFLFVLDVLIQYLLVLVAIVVFSESYSWWRILDVASFADWSIRAFISTICCWINKIMLRLKLRAELLLVLNLIHFQIQIIIIIKCCDTQRDFYSGQIE